MSNVTVAKIEKMIYVIRGQKVMLDSDLAELYEVSTKALNQAVKRNLERFPDDFMFQLNQAEFNQLQSYGAQYGGLRYHPYVFTENGVAMLSTVLRSAQAVQINISIMRIFTKLRSFLLLEKELSERMSKLEEGTNKLFKVVFERLDSIEDTQTPTFPSKRRKIGLRKEET